MSPHQDAQSVIMAQLEGVQRWALWSILSNIWSIFSNTSIIREASVDGRYGAYLTATKRSLRAGPPPRNGLVTPTYAGSPPPTCSAARTVTL